MEGQTDVVAAVDLIDDVDAARCPVQEHRTSMQGRRVKRGVPVVLSRPSGDVAVIEYLDLASTRMTHRHEGTAHGARAGQDVYARVAHFDGQSIRVGMRSDAAVPVRAAVAPAPDLIFPARAQ